MFRKFNLLLLIAFCVGQGTAQEYVMDPNILVPTGSGPRAEAMGRAFTAVADDATALGWNPAGIAQIRQNQASVSGNMNFGSTSLTPPKTLMSSQEFDVSQGTTFGLNYIGFTIPIPVTNQNYNLVSSVAIRNHYDFADKLTFSSIDNARGLTVIDENIYNGGLFYLSGGMAVDVLPNLFVGGALNLISGQYKYKHSSFATTPVFQDTTWSEWKNTFSGFNFEFGFLWQASPSVRLGSRFTLPHKVQFTNLEYENSANITREYEGEVYLSMPLQMQVGGALNLTRDLLFAFDYNLRPWDQIETTVQDSTFDNTFSATNSFHMGIEYRLLVGDAMMPWRIGFFNQPEQLYEFNANAENQIGDQMSSHFMTTGFGLHTPNVHFDLALAVKFMQYETGYFGIGNNPFELKRTTFRLMAGLEVVL